MPKAKSKKRARTLTDTQALDRIHKLMDGEEWDSDTTSSIEQIILKTGRPKFRDPNESSDEDQT